MIEAELPDGRVLEFPDGTDPTVVQSTVKKLLGVSAEPKRGSAALAGVNKGIAGLVGLPMDTAENLVNLGIAGIGSIATAAGRPDLAPNLIRGTPGGSESLSAGLNKLGIGTDNPSPTDAASRLLYTGGVIAGGSLMPGARPLPTAASAASGAVAGELGGPQWTGVGAMLPAAAMQAGQAARTAIADRVNPRIEEFKQAGTTPSVGQATEANFIQGFENLLAKFPGGQGVFRKFSENQQKQLGDTARTGVSAEDAGRAIEKGVTGFLGRTKQVWQDLDNQVAQKVPADYGVKPINTMAALEELTNPVKGAAETSKVLRTSRMVDIKDAIVNDTQGRPILNPPTGHHGKPTAKTITLLDQNGKPLTEITLRSSPGSDSLPYEALRSLRSRVGALMDDALVSGIPGGELKKLYGAISKDLEVAASQTGAGEAFARQNNFYRARMERIEGTLERVLGNTPEETFSRFMPKDAEQATKVRSVMRSLDPEQRQVVSEAVVNRLGRATPGRQNEAGDVFSPETFLTNWNKLSDGAKAQLFSDASMRKNMDALAKVSENLRSGAKVFANPSGTAGAAAPMGIGYLAARGAVSAVTGDVAGAAYHLGTAGALMGGAQVGAKMLTSPKVVEWLAQYPKVAPEAGAVHLARLGVIYNETKDAKLKEELGAFINSVQK